MSAVEYVRMVSREGRQLVVGINREGNAVWSKFVRTAPSYFEHMHAKTQRPRRRWRDRRL